MPRECRPRMVCCGQDGPTVGSFSMDARAIINCLAVTKEGLARWHREREDPLAFLGETTSSNADTRTELTPQGDAAYPDTPDGHETALDEPAPQTGARLTFSKETTQSLNMLSREKTI